MRAKQAHLNYEDSLWKTGSMERAMEASAKDLGVASISSLLSSTRSVPAKARGKDRMKVQCLECSRVFWTDSFLPTCPGCGGSDCEPA